MSWYAVDSLDDALGETQSLLLPFDAWTWARLAIIALFAGLSPPQTPTVSMDVPPQTIAEYSHTITEPQFVAFALGVLAVGLLIGLVFAIIGSVMEFVLVDALRSRTVRLRAPFRDRFSQGLRLFGFRLAITIVVLLAVAAVVAPIILVASTDAALVLLALLVTIPLLAVVSAAVALVAEFTTAFVVPLMAEHGDGVLAGWRRFWPTLRAEWKDFGVYVLVKVVLVIGAGIAFSLAGAIVAVPIGLAVFGAALTPIALIAVAIAALVGFVVLAAVSVPIVTGLRYHSLCTLAASQAEFTLR